MSEKILKKFAVDKDFKFIECINLIMNSIYFRKLADKTQVIISLTGPNVRTRLTHTVEVAKIAKDMCNRLGLNEDLAEAISLAHDIGHTPFGHVGERTLKEIMCNCDTLDKNVNVSFNNSGFKHNLQSFRLLRRQIPENLKKEFKYLLWGVAAHSNMTYTPLDSGLDNEIHIHPKHCLRVYNCSLCIEGNSSFKNRCKFNKKNKKDNITSNDLCSPWYCAKLEDTEKDFTATICKGKCYFSKVWNYRLLEKEKYSNFQYFFDYPFLNSFYAQEFYEEFISNYSNFVSFETIIVNIADEIAQRKQDLEDAINQKLISHENCHKTLKEYFKENIENPDQINTKIREFLSRIDGIVKKQDLNSTKDLLEIGQALAEFLIEVFILKIQTKFSETLSYNEENKISFYQYYDFVEMIKNANETDNFKRHYFLENDIISHLNNFNLSLTRNKKNKFVLKKGKDNGDYIFCKIHEYLDFLIKSNNDLSINWLNIRTLVPLIKNKDIRTDIKIILDKPFNDETYILLLKHIDIWKKKYRFIIEQYSGFNFLPYSKFRFLYNIYKPENADSKIFNIYLSKYYSHANQDLMSYIVPKKSDSKSENFETCYSKLEDFLRDTILKSEIVEKNDGKASYIIKRLFRAYLSNPHQLSDDSIIKLWKTYNKSFLNNKDYENYYNNFLHDLINDLPNYPDCNKLFELFKWGESIDDSIVKKYPKEIIELYNSKNKLIKLESKIKQEDKQIPVIRIIIDNSFLNTIPSWNQAVYRGICDHIAGLTDRQAISEYGKLYSGIMELS
jgi:dGTP triphosphohydrolase